MQLHHFVVRSRYWKTSAGEWQRFGPGFYFAQHASKMLLCKVARGKIFKTVENMDSLKGAAPHGFDSVHGDARTGGALMYDEVVVYREEAVLPIAVVEYRFMRH
eukprot:COSAG02_NODE_10696_length_1881_cov_1.847924_2_plen_104_part_00